MAILIKGTDFESGDQVTATNLDAHVDNATFASGAVDGSTTELSGGAIAVRAGGIGASHLADDAISAAKIADSSITNAKVSVAAGIAISKLEELSDMVLVGNMDGDNEVPQEIPILDEDDMSSNSAVSIPTQQSVKAYVDSTATMTPPVFTTEESVTLPNGLVMKFGTEDLGENASTVITFGDAFENECQQVQVTPNSSVPTGADDNVCAHTLSTTGFTLVNGIDGGTYTLAWMAIGY